jgi:hypothetical protein
VSIRDEPGGAKARRRTGSMTFMMLGWAVELFTGSAPELGFAGAFKAEAYCLRSGGLVPYRCLTVNNRGEPFHA